MLRLRLEDGILLKEYARPWRKDGWGKAPRGWTAEDRGEWIENRVEEIVAEMRKKNLMPSRFFARQQAATEQGKVFSEKKQPWPGWVPVGTGADDRHIRKAYRELFIRMNLDSEGVTNGVLLYRLDDAEFPADGDYVLENGEMRPVEGDDNGE